VSRRHRNALLLLGPPLAFLLVVFVIPIARAAWGSLFAPSFTLEHYARIWRVAVYARVFLSTLEIAALTTLACLLLGYPAAYFLASLRPRARQALLLCVVIPFFLSVLIRNYVWIALLQETGLINRLLLRAGVIGQPLALMYNELGVLIGMVNTLLPYMIFPILSSLLAIPRELEHASASLGASAPRTFVRITLPLTLPGIAAGSLLVFIVSLGFFVTPALLGGPKQMMMSNVIDFNVREVLNWPFAFAVSNVLLTATLVLYGVYLRALRGRLPGGGVL